MKVVASYSHKDGTAFIEKHFKNELQEINDVIGAVDASHASIKISKEKTMPGRKLYDPRTLNKLFKQEFFKRGWKNYKINTSVSVPLLDKALAALTHKGFREIDFVKNKLGVEVQFGKYAFMVYNVSAKMTIFHNKGIIEAGIEIVPMKSMADKMSTGVSFLEQFSTDLEMRGVADIDIPVLIVGIVQ